MKKILILLFINSFAFAQKTILKASYLYTNYDLEERANVELLVDGMESFSRFTKINKTKDTLFFDDMGAATFNQESSDSIKYECKINIIQKNIIFRDFIMKGNEFEPVVVKENLPQQNWILLNGEKKINHYICYSAKLSFRGRDYIAWYTPDIPASSGPWKFYGLPGLITEIRSSDNKISFILKTIQSQKGVFNPQFSAGKEMKMEKYIAVKKSTVDEFIRTLKANLPRGAVVSYTSGDNNLEKNFD